MYTSKRSLQQQKSKLEEVQSDLGPSRTDKFSSSFVHLVRFSALLAWDSQTLIVNNVSLLNVKPSRYWTEWLFTKGEQAGLQICDRGLIKHWRWFSYYYFRIMKRYKEKESKVDVMAGTKFFVGEPVAPKDHRPPISLCNYYKRF